MANKRKRQLARAWRLMRRPTTQWPRIIGVNPRVNLLDLGRMNGRCIGFNFQYAFIDEVGSFRRGDNGQENK